MNIRIRPALPQDAEGLLAHLRQVGGETDNLSFGPEGLPLSVEDEARYIAALNKDGKGLMLVALSDKQIVASASLSPLPRRMGHRAEVGMTVLKEYWGHGLGSRMAEELISFARQKGLRQLEVYTRSDNAAAIALCSKFGFIKLCLHPAFIRAGDSFHDAWLMYLPL